MTFRNHSRLASKRAHKIFHTKGMGNDKADLYDDFIGAASKTLDHLEKSVWAVDSACTDPSALDASKAQVEHYKPLIQQVIDQAQRRVLMGEQVPAQDEVQSIFEEHADIIIKGKWDIQYGHKINLSSGNSGLILDVVIEEGNPADTERLQPMLERHIERYAGVPRQVAADGGYASAANLEKAKALGVEDMAFHKKCGMHIADMVKSKWVYSRSENFRAGIESNISCL